MIEVIQEGHERIKPITTFKDAGLHPVMLRNTELAGYLVPTPIQRYTLPAIFEGKDLIACAQTGKSLFIELFVVDSTKNSRFRKDCRLLNSHLVKIDGQGQEALRTTS